MADYIRIAGRAEAEAFDGSKTSAEALVAAYPDIISIQSAAHKYPILSGPNAYNAGETGTVLAIVDVKAGDFDTPAVVTIEVTTGASAAGTVTISVRGFRSRVELELDGTEDAAAVATAISILDFGDNWVVTIDENNLVKLTEAEDLAKDAVLAVLDENGGVLNAYATDYIVFETPYFGMPDTKIVSAVDFAYWYTAVVE